MGTYFPETAKAQEFLELKQGAMTVMDYVTRVTELARFVDDCVATDLAKVRRFETLEEPLYVSSPLGIRARIRMICRGCELEISGTLLIVDPRIMDMSGSMPSWGWIG